MTSIQQADETLNVTSETAEATPVESDPAVAEDLAHLIQLLERDAVEEARVLIRELVVRWPDSERMRHWARVLEPPRTRVERGGRERPLHREQAWLREHAHEHPGCWLSVYHDRLLAADPDLQAVLA